MATLLSEFRADGSLQAAVRRTACFLIGWAVICGGLGLFVARAADVPGETPAIALLNSSAAGAAGEAEKRSWRAPVIRPRAFQLSHFEQAVGFVPERTPAAVRRALGAPPKERSPPQA